MKISLVNWQIFCALLRIETTKIKNLSMDYLKKFEDIIQDDSLTFEQGAKAMFVRYQAFDEGLEAIQKYSQLAKELQERDVINHCLKTDNIMPNFTVKNYLGEYKNIFQLYDKTPFLVLSFYRGQFCPFCNLELKSFQRELAMIESCPATLVAISPQNEENSYTTHQNNQLTYELLSDVGGKVAKMFGLSYVVPDYLKDFHLKLGVSQEYFNEKGQMELVMPATYIIDKEGKILFHFAETVAGLRLDPKKAVAFIKKLM